jgi:hypothetical protein
VWAAHRVEVLAAVAILLIAIILAVVILSR